MENLEKRIIKGQVETLGKRIIFYKLDNQEQPKVKKDIQIIEWYDAKKGLIRYKWNEGIRYLI